MSGAAAEERLESAPQRRGFGAQRYRHRRFLLFLPVSTGLRTRPASGGGAARRFAALGRPGVRRTGRALPTCSESRPVPIPPPLHLPIPHTPAPPRGGPGGRRRRRRDSVRFPRGGERLGREAGAAG